MTRAPIIYLYGLQARGVKFGLRNVRRLVEAAGHPERAFPSLHVAGSNGKGSTSAYLASVFMEAGYRTGLYTSPHVIRFNERIRINGVEIADADLARLVQRLQPSIERTRATFFEATTCMAFLYFAEQGVDVAVVETGLGGRLDATNVVLPLVSVITTISLEHTEYLGTTIRSIAREKGGIIKPAVPVVTGVTDAVALEVLDRIAAGRRTGVVRVSDEVRITGGRTGPGRFSFAASRLVVRGVRPGFPGAHQVRNAALAVAVLSTLLRDRKAARMFPAIDAAAVRRGLERALRNTGLRGRLERVGRRVVLDVAHNPEGMRTTVEALRGQRATPWNVVFGVMKDKELGPMARQLRGFARRILTVSPRTKRAVPASTLARALRRLGAEAQPAGSVAEGVKKALRFRGHVLVTGSHYVVGEALPVLGSRD